MKNRERSNTVKSASSLETQGKTKSAWEQSAKLQGFSLIQQKKYLRVQHSRVTIVFQTVGKNSRKTFVGINGMCLGFCGQNFWDSAETRFWLKTYMVFITL